MQGNTVLVLGATGNTGRRVVERLMSRDVPVRAGSRSGEPAFDWSDRSTWANALRGVESVYVSYYPDFALPDAAATVGALADLAVRSGVRRLVLLSGRGEEGALRAEEAVRASGADWTILRSSWFCQNFSEGFFVEQVLQGEIALPATDAVEPFVDADDIADAAAVALTEDGHSGRLYELTGPRLLTFAEAIDEIARATGRGIRYVPIPAERWVSLLDGRNAYVTDGVRRVLGREARDFADYAWDAAAAGAWGPVHAERR